MGVSQKRYFRRKGLPNLYSKKPWATDRRFNQPFNGIQSKTNTASDRIVVATGRFGPLPQWKVFNDAIGRIENSAQWHNFLLFYRFSPLFLECLSTQPPNLLYPARNFPAVGVKEDSEITPLLVVCFHCSSESFRRELPSYSKLLQTPIGVLQNRKRGRVEGGQTLWA